MNKILIIDDEEDVREVVKNILEIDGWMVDTAPDGESAILSLEENKHALIICDISMPGISGLETIAKIRKKGLVTAAVMLTAHDDKDRIIEALQLGAIDYIVKPFDPIVLRSKIPNWLEVGRRLQDLASQEGGVTNEFLTKQLRMIELFKLNNHKQSKG